MHSRLKHSVQHKRNNIFPVRKKFCVYNIFAGTKLNCIALSLAPAARGDSAGGPLAWEPPARGSTGTAGAKLARP